MNKIWFERLLGIAVLGCALVVVSTALPGCGGATSTGHAQLVDSAEVDKSNRSMQDYMNSPEGKKASKPR